MNPINYLTKSRMIGTFAFTLGFAGFGPASAAPSDYPPVQFSAADGWGKKIRRTMRLPASSTPEKRTTVRITK